jgi:hypothetical protein
MRTSVALCAQAIRKDLKAAYPNTKFTVRSKNYSGGDSINVGYTMTIDSPRQKEVETLLSKYEEGHFDGMTDMYNYKTDRGDLGTKYLFVHANIDQLGLEKKEEFMKYWDLKTDRDDECRERTGRYFGSALGDYLEKFVLVVTPKNDTTITDVQTDPRFS